MGCALGTLLFSDPVLCGFDSLGMFNLLTKELGSFQDPLSCLCAWSLFRDITCELSAPSNMTDISDSICQILGPHVKLLLEESEDVALLAGMLSAVAPIVGTSMKTDEEGMDPKYHSLLCNEMVGNQHDFYFLVVISAWNLIEAASLHYVYGLIS